MSKDTMKYCPTRDFLIESKIMNEVAHYNVLLKTPSTGRPEI